jgi:hypothetical protein
MTKQKTSKRKKYNKSNETKQKETQARQKYSITKKKKKPEKT